MSDASAIGGVTTSTMSDAEMEASMLAANQPVVADVASAVSMLDDSPIDPDGTSTIPVAAASAASAQVGGMNVADAMVGKGEPLVVRGQEFTLVAELPAYPMLQLSRLEDPDFPTYKKSGAMSDILEAAVIPEQRAAWVRLLSAASPPIGMEELGELTGKVVERVVGRPT